MKRLTRWIDEKEKDIAIQGKEATKDECLKRLAEYEDTGLTPKGIKKMKHELKVLRNTVAHYGIQMED